MPKRPRSVNGEGGEIKIVWRRGQLAEALVHMGEFSTAKQVLVGEELAPGSRHTLDMLRDKSWKPRHPRTPPALANLEPQVSFSLDGDLLSRNLRSAKRVQEDHRA